MATHEDFEIRKELNEKRERILKENLKNYLEKNPFPKGNYPAQKKAYEKLVERLMRMEQKFNLHSHDSVY